MIKKKSVLFFVPDYHCSFFLRDEFRKLGWRADIFVPPTYPEYLLYSKDVITFLYKGRNQIIKLLQNVFYFIYFMIRYKYFIVYGTRFRFLYLMSHGTELAFGIGFNLSLAIAKRLGKVFIHEPSGDCDHLLFKDIWELFQGKKCRHCWRYRNRHCTDWMRKQLYEQQKNYANLVLGYHGYSRNPYFAQKAVRYKSLDLELWKPELEVPQKFKVENNGELLIFHSLADPKRSRGNQKGSNYIVNAVQKLISEGYNIMLLHPRNIPSKDMRFYQVQADIVVEQLISGWWGSTGVETLALGKPVVCYLHPQFKKTFLETFPGTSLPIVEANDETIYNVLKHLIENPDFREMKARESRKFALEFYDKQKNAKELETIMLNLVGQEAS